MTQEALALILTWIWIWYGNTTIFEKLGHGHD